MKKDNRRLERAGWVLFTLCAIFYIAANIRVGDWLSLLGSIFFLLACLVFFLTLNNGGEAG